MAELLPALYDSASAARLSYLEGKFLAAEADKAGFEVIGTVSRGTHFAAVFDRAGFRYLAFRGTNDVADWRTNLRIFPQRTGWGWVHRGFFGATESLWSELRQYLSSATRTQIQLWLTGHSLGGALALLAAVRVEMDAEAAVAGLSTFGQPRVGGLRFCANCDKALGARYVRLVNHTDGISGAPILLYSHCGHLWYFDVKGELHHEVNLSRLVQDHTAAPRKFGGLSQFTAHPMDRYLALLQSQMDRQSNRASDGAV